MKKHKLLLTLGTVAAVAAPIAAVVSCGGGSSKGTSAKKEATNEWASNDATISANLVIAEPKVRHGVTKDEVDPGMWEKLVNKAGWSVDWETYVVTLPNSNHSFKFNIEKALGITKENANKLISKWAKYANWGYSVLTLDNIFVTKQDMGSAGWAGQGKDVLLAAPADQSNGGMQNLYNTLHHEFGHHETLSLIDGNGIKQTDNLIKNTVIGSQMHNNAIANSATEEDRLIAEMAKTNPSTLLGSIYGIQDPYQHGAGEYTRGANGASSFVFNADYHLKGGEFLNRAMNVLELMPWDDADKATLYQFPDIFKYQMGEQGRALYDANGSWTNDAHTLVDLYGKYVYGYDARDGYGLHIEGNELKGFSNDMFDFVKIDGTAYKVDHIESHYVTKDQIFAEPTIIKAPAAFHATLPASTAASVASKNVEFFADSNKDGKLDENDQKISITFQ